MHICTSEEVSIQVTLLVLTRMEEYKESYQFLMKNTYPTGFSKNQKRFLRRKSRKFCVKKGISVLLYLADFLGEQSTSSSQWYSSQPRPWQIWSLANCQWCQNHREIFVYDSLYSSLGSHTKKSNFFPYILSRGWDRSQVYGRSKQAGSTDCNLFVVAFATCIANGVQPSVYTFRQQDIRNCL